MIKNALPKYISYLHIKLTLMKMERNQKINKIINDIKNPIKINRELDREFDNLMKSLIHKIKNNNNVQDTAIV